MSKDWDYTSSFLLASVTSAAGKAAGLLQAKKAVRIGQSAVASHNMHTFHPQTPENLNILQDVDAGQAFYQRCEMGTVVHADIFHECGKVDHRTLAANLKKAIGAYNLHVSVSSIIFDNRNANAIDPNYVDIQTGTGGGRITGSLTYGQKQSLRKAHENHVHIAVSLKDGHIAGIFYLIMAAEDAILASGLELRCNEKIVYVKGKSDRTGDFSPYADQTDSFLQEKKATATNFAFKQHQFKQDAIVLSDSFDTVDDIRDMLRQITIKGERKKLEKQFDTNGNAEQMLTTLEGLGIVEVNGKRVELTEYGVEFYRYINENFIEIQSELKQMLKSLKPIAAQSNHTTPKNNYADGTSIVISLSESRGKAQIAVSETVMAAARRQVTNPGRLTFNQDDIKVRLRHYCPKNEIMLLIDSSASMKGQRILAAKFLIRHLLLTTPDKIGVITFQDYSAQVHVPLTRDYQRVESSLRQIRADGATPLALGIKTCLNYLDGVKTNNPLIILLTDGVPTLPDISRDPIADAIEYAKSIKEAGHGFMGIGLKPHRNYLSKLAEAAGGRLYLLDELEKQVLVNTAWLDLEQRRV